MNILRFLGTERTLIDAAPYFRSGHTRSRSASVVSGSTDSDVPTGHDDDNDMERRATRAAEKKAEDAENAGKDSYLKLFLPC